MPEEDAFRRATNEVGEALWEAAQPLWGRYSQDEVLVGIAVFLGQSLAGHSISPRTLHSISAIVEDGLRHAE